MRIDHFIAVVFESEKGLALPGLAAVMRDEDTDARGIEVCGCGRQDAITSREEVGLSQSQQPRGGIALGRGKLLLLPGFSTIMGHIDPRVLSVVAIGERTPCQMLCTEEALKRGACERILQA